MTRATRGEAPGQAAPAGSVGRKGFALAMVVFLLFAVSVAAMAGYQLVSVEAALATASEQTGQALAAARAGLERYVGEHLGEPAPASYVIGDGDVTVTPRLLAVVDTDTDLYLLEAVGTVADSRYPSSPAKRTVLQYAYLHKSPVNVTAALMSVASTVTVNGALGATTISGTDLSASSDCVGAPKQRHGVLNLSGGAGTGSVTGGPSSNPPARKSVGSIQAVLDTAAVRWSVLKDPTFPIPYDGSWPNFSTLPSDSFPIVRYQGNLSTGAYNVHSGRGLLIVTGTFSVGAFSTFAWNGIILAGRAGTLNDILGSVNIQGALITGLNGAAPATVTVGGGFGSVFTLRNRTCYIREANNAAAYFELLNRSRLES